jgi:hypothetical protein
LADVFVHGIGGAAYDGITDDIVRRMTGSDPPRHAVVSGTLRLPLDHAFPGFEGEDPAGLFAQARATLRDMEFHPERHLDPRTLESADVVDLIAAKRRWIETHPTVTLARRRCREIRATNERLTVHLADAQRDEVARTTALAAAAKARTVLRSREYPWCFFPENALKSFLLLENGAESA